MWTFAYGKDYTGLHRNPILSVNLGQRQGSLAGRNSRVPMQTFPHQIPKKPSRNVHKKQVIKNTKYGLKRRALNEQLNQQCSTIRCWWTRNEIFLAMVRAVVHTCLANIRHHATDEYCLNFYNNQNFKTKVIRLTLITWNPNHTAQHICLCASCGFYKKHRSLHY